MPHIVKELLLLALGSILLSAGANYFIEGASLIAARLGVSQLSIGVTLVALGTSLPEFFVSLVALLKGSCDISIGNVVGSNICNIGLILGTAAILKPVSIPKSLKQFELPMFLVSAALLYLFCLNMRIGTLEGLIYLALLVVFTARYTMEKRYVEAEAPKTSLPISLLMTAGGLTALILGSNIFTESAIEIARILGVSQLVIGLTLVALGTSLPELASTVAATLKGKSDIAIGNVIGSNIINLIFILGTICTIKPLKTRAEIVKLDIPFMLLLSAFVALLTFKGRVSRLAGLILLGLYIIYIGLLYTHCRV